ncbi:hypothetical protein F3J29_16645 [Enterobacter sp. Cy-643]|uniref:hypothetical protein n=1 Tax=Enterobacter sp. Cy-643 TaxID=2608346 RepID=UPI00141D839D|nr:hypothetical protein [Enterobacter sp. Cy-643]NIF33758.1 hypothetical protein [Enterobacter sp. Cy-643]
MIAVEFGSKHNGFPSLLSDRDLLIVHEDWSQVDREMNRFKLLGYDISIMHRKKMGFLCASGSLFMKHIIDQGVVIFGGEGEINRARKEWTPKLNYQTEINENLELLELLGFLPKNNYSSLFAIDLLIISIRNILIRRFAAEGMYIFSWEQLFDSAVKFKWLSERDVSILLISRKIKNAYRNKIYFNVGRSFLDVLMSIARKVIGLNFYLGFCNNKKTILSLPERFADRSYKQLRSIEIICSYYGYGHNVNHLHEMVASPSYFCNAKL